MKIACLLVTHLRAKLEMQRQPHLWDRPVLIADRSQGRPLVVDHFPAASGVAAGMILEQALSRQTGGVVLYADEAAYRRAFHRMFLSLQGVSDRVEGAELGTAYVRLPVEEGVEAPGARRRIGTGPMPKHRIHNSSMVYFLPDDFPGRPSRFQRESGLSWAEVARRVGTSDLNVGPWRNGVRPHWRRCWSRPKTWAWPPVHRLDSAGRNGR